MDYSPGPAEYPKPIRLPEEVKDLWLFVDAKLWVAVVVKFPFSIKDNILSIIFTINGCF